MNEAPTETERDRLSAAEETLNTLSHWIESGELKVGSFLPSERQLAVQLGVSRVVVREAAKKLEQRGLVSIRQGVGVCVTDHLSLPLQGSFHHMIPEEKQRLIQCSQVRILIEPEVAALAARNVNSECLRKLAQVHEALLHEPDIQKAAQHDIEFHQLVAGMAGNKILALVLTTIAELGRLAREHTLREFGTRRAYDFHEKIMAAIAAGDSTAARQAMKSHLAAALGDLL